MSQVSHPTIPIRNQLRTTLRAHQVAWSAALLALLATVAIVLVVAIDGGQSSTNPVTGQAQPAVRSNGGPNEAAVAAAVSSRASTGPSESRIAASIGGAGTARPTSRPDESAVAAAVGSSESPTPAASVSRGRPGAGPGR